MKEIRELIGHYYGLEYFTKKVSREYRFDIYANGNSILECELELIKRESYGRVGKKWRGSCVIDSGKLKFEYDKEIQLSDTIADHSVQETKSKEKKIIVFNIINGKDFIGLNLNLELKEIPLIKLKREIEESVSMIIKNIVDHHQIEKVISEGKPGIFWRISNLTLKSTVLDLNPQVNQIQLVCEYDLDIVKEEKRVIDFDEVKRTHHKAELVIDKSKNAILEFKSF
ncbi:MAG: hypothetical protein GF383_05640 [Candidatus Lokiarchaeota archaeon]|nr:hypothetical protein [Candidatus Lokiarchaeota archaeon]